MNKIFRIIWSKTLNRLVVVSELATGQCKASSAGQKPAEINEQSCFLSKLSKLYLNPITVSVALVLGTMSMVANADWDWVWTRNDTGTTGFNGTGGWFRNHMWNSNSIILAKIDNGTAGDANKNVKNAVVIGTNGAYAKGDGSTVVGSGAYSTKQDSTVIGKGSYANMNLSVAVGERAIVHHDAFGVTPGLEGDGQGVALGSAVYATAQATSVGNNAYAIGRSSIAIGNDDTAAYSNKISSHDYENYFKTLYANIDSSGNTYGYASNNPTPVKAENTKYSPTLAQGHGSIAIGSRSIAYADGATALGTLAFALKQGSTAVGTETRAEGAGAIAFGRRSNVFADNAIAAGNDTLVLKDGGAAYGFDALSGGTNSIAIGTHVYANTEINYAGKVFLKSPYKGAAGTQDKPIETSLLGDEKYTADSESVRGLYGFDLNGIARSVLGVATEMDDHSRFEKGAYLKSGNYFINYKDYLTGLENALVYAYDDKNFTNKISSIPLGKETKNGVDNIAKSSGKNAIVIGSRSGAFGSNGLALGRGAFSLGDNSFAIGSYSFAKQRNALAVGIASRALGENSVAFGNGAGTDTTAKNAMTFGPGSVTYAADSIILGINSRIWGTGNPIKDKDDKVIGYDGGNSILIGNKASVEGLKDTKGHNGRSVMALGNETKATLENSVALGYLSQTDYSQDDLDKPGYTARGSYSIPTSAKVGIISVGKRGYERRIANVASGYRDSDAVTVSQLRTIEDRLDGVSEEADNKVKYFSVKSGTELANIAKKEIEYRNYVKLKTQMLTVEARRKDGETINEANIAGLKTKLQELEAKANIVDHATNIKALGNLDQEKYKTNGKFDLAKYMAALEAAKDKDSTAERIAAIITADERAKLTEGNYSNEGATGANAIAIGPKAKATMENAISLGNDAQATVENSVALGSGSRNTATLTNFGYNPATKVAYTSEANVADAIWKPTHGEVAVGNGTTLTRRITGVAAGDADTDAVNVAQLKRVVSGAGVEYFSVNKERPRDDNSTFVRDVVNKITATTNQDNKGATANSSIAIGAGSISKVDASVAIGYGAKNNNFNTDDRTNYNEKSAIAIGLDAQTTGSDAIALGQSARASGGNAFALGKVSKATANGAVAIGLLANATTENSVALGAASVADRTGGQFGYDPNLFANRAQANTPNAGAWKSGTYGAISVGKAGFERQIINVAAGSADTDAVNVAQLKNVTLRVTDTQGKRATPATASEKLKLSEGMMKFVGSDDISATAATNSNDVNVTFALQKGTVTSTEEKAVSGQAVYTAVRDARTTVAKGNNESILEVTGGTQGGITAKAYTLSINKDVLKTEVDRNFVSNTEFSETAVTSKVQKGNLQVTDDELVFADAQSGDNRLVGTGNLKIGLSQTVKNQLASIANKANQTDLTTLQDKSLTISADSGTFNRKNSETKTLSIKAGTFSHGQGTAAVRYSGDNLRTEIGANANELKIGLREDPTFTTVKITDGPTINSTGINLNEKALTNLPQGNITSASKDAISGKQLKDLADKLGVGVATGDKTFKNLSFTKVEGSGATNGSTTVKGAVDDLITAVNKGLVFLGNSKEDKAKITRKLGEELQIKGEGTTPPADGETAANNINVTALSTGELEIRLAKALTNLTSVGNNANNKITFGTGETDTTATTIKVGGKDLTLTKSNDKVAITGLADPTADDGAATKKYVDGLLSNPTGIKLTYKATDTAGTAAGDAKKVALTSGLNFKATTNINTAVDDNGVVTHTLNDTLTGIGSIKKADDQGSLNLTTNSASLESAKDNSNVSLTANKAIISAGKDKSKIEVQTGVADTDNKIVFTPKNGTTVTLDHTGKLTGLASGNITTGSTDAIAGKQLKDLADKLGVNVTTANNTGFDAPTLSKTYTAAGAEETAAPTSLVAAINKTVEVLNRGIKYGADQYGADSGSDAAKKTQYLGSTVDIKAGTADTGFVGTNLKTKYTYSDGNGLFEIGLSETPTFKGVTSKTITIKGEPGANGAAGKDAVLGADANGNLTVINGKDGTNGTNGTPPTASEVLTKANIDSLVKLKYKANSDANTAKEVALSKGLDFTNGTNTNAAIGENGVVKFNLNSTLASITSVSNDTNNKIEFGTGITGDTAKVTITAAGEALTITKDNTGVAVKGLTARTTTSTDYGTNGNEGRAATEGALRALTDTLGITPNDGATGNTGATGATGPAGKDGLDGESIVKKVEALRDGLAGNMVYTNADGTRVQKAKDGKYYEADKVTKDGQKIVEAGGKKYADLGGGKYKEVDDKGEIKANAVEVDQNTVADLANATQPSEVKAKDIIISAVNPDGTTTNPLAIGNLASALGLENVKPDAITTSTAIDATNAKEAMTNLLAKAGKDLTKAVTLADLQAVAQAGLDFGADAGADIHRALGTKLSIVGNKADADKMVKAVRTEMGLADGATLTAAQATTYATKLATEVAKTHSNKNIVTITDPTNNEIELHLAKNLVDINSVGNDDTSKITFNKGVAGTTATPASAVITVDGKELTVSKDDSGVAVTGLTARTTETSGYGDGNNAKRAATEGAVKALETKLAKNNTALDGKLGDPGKDGTDGRNGTNAAGNNGVAGPAGKDGLNGTNVNDKVNALRRGEAGPVVYTDAEGNRLVKAIDGNYYEAKDVTKEGYKIVAGNDNKKYADLGNGKYKEVENGEIKDKAQEVEANTVTATQPPAIGADDVVLSIVNSDGQTTKPLTLNNLASALGLDNVIAADPKTSTAIDAAKAKTAVDTLLKEKGKNLTKAVTLADLQAVAQAGLDFGADAGADIHRALGTKLSIVGNATDAAEIVKKAKTATGLGETADVPAAQAGTYATKLAEEVAKTHSNKNIVTITDPTNNEIELHLAKNLVDINSVGNDNTSKITFTKKVAADPAANTAAVDASAVITVDGKDLTITKDGATGADGVSITGLTERNIDSDAYGTGNNKTRAATESAVRNIADTLGLTPNNGANGNPGLDGTTGPSGKDGLNGTNIVNKVDALRDGTAGNMVYTKEDGTRLQQANDGKYYEADKVTKEGYKIVEANGKKYADLGGGKYKEVENGEIKAGATEETLANTVAKTEPDEVAADKIVISAVNANGETTAPLTLRNIASVLGTDVTAKYGDKAGGDATAQAAAQKAAIDKAKELVSGTDGLINKTADLDKAVTLKDLQVLAIAGLEFTGNDGKTHRTLGTTLEIFGKTPEAGKTIDFTTNYTTANLATKVTEGKVQIGLAKDLVEIDSITTNKTANKQQSVFLPTGVVAKTYKDATGKDVENETELTSGGVVVKNETDKTNLTPAGLEMTDKDGLTTKKRNKINKSSITLTDQTPATDPTANDAKDDSNVITAAGNTLTNTKTGDTTTVKANEIKVANGTQAVTITKNSVTGAEKLGYDDSNNIVFRKAEPAGTDATANPAKPIRAVITVDGKALTLTKATDGKAGSHTEGVALTGLADRDTSLADYGTDKTRAATEAAVKALATNSGNPGKDGEDGRNGKDPAGTTGKVGPAGKDGLNGVNVNDKVNALRRGEAGPVVYTDDTGNRLVKAIDGNYYKDGDVTKEGYKIIAGDAGKKYVELDNGKFKEVDAATGEIAANATELDSITKAPDADQPKAISADKVFLSAVNANGETTAPLTLRNIASVLGTAETAKYGDTSGNDVANKASKDNAITTAKNLVSGTTGLINKTTDLDKAVTLKDLQVLAIAGLDFGADAGADIHRTLGTKVSIVGGSDASKKAIKAAGLAEDVDLTTITEDQAATYATKLAEEIAANYSSKNIVTSTNTTTNAIVLHLAKDLVDINSVGNDNTSKITFNKNVPAAGTATATPASAVITVDGKELTVKKAADGNTANDKGEGVSLTGLVDRDAKLADYGTDRSRAATEGAVKDLANALGIKPNDGSAGTDGNNGGDGTTGPGGKDGLNGGTILDKLNGLRDGTAGNMVYTKKDGTRLQQANDGKYYEADKVTKEGHKIVDAGGTKYADLGDGKFKEIDLATNEIKEGVNVVDATSTPALATPTQPDAIANKDIMISAVNPDGSTTAPLALGNLASALDLANAKTTNDQGDAVTPTAITDDKAKKAVNGLLTQDEDLSKAVTLADLQAVAVAGLNFEGNTGANVHKKLSETLAIVGNKELFKEAKTTAEAEAQKAVLAAMGIDAVPAEGATNKADYDEKYKAELEKQLTTANEAVTAKFSDKNVITTTDGNEVSIKLAKKPEFEGIDVKDPADNKKSVAITPDGMTVTKVEGTAPNTTTTTTNVGADGTSITREEMVDDPDNQGATIKKTDTASYGIDGATVEDRDGNSTSMDATGVEINNNDGNYTNLNAEGLEVTDTAGNTNTISSDGLVTKDKDGNKATVAPTEIKLGKDGKDGQPGKDSVVLKAADDNNGGSVAVGNKDGKETVKLDGGNGTDAPTVTVKNNDGTKDSVTIKGADGTNGPSIDFAKAENGTDGKNGTGAITGLADLTDGSDGTSAANKNYVDEKLADANAGQPFEYYTKDLDAQTGKPEKVVRGRDGKLYKETDLADYKFDKANNKYVHKTTGADLPTDKVLDSDKVIVKAMPNAKPMAIGNVAAGLGEKATDVTAKYGDKSGTDDENAKNKADAIAKAKELIAAPATGTSSGLVNITDSTVLNKVATLKDLQAVAIAGLTFTGNHGEDVHRPLGTTLSIVGNKDIDTLSKAFKDAVAALDALNKDVNSPADKITAAKAAKAEAETKLNNFVGLFSDKNLITVTDKDKNELSIRMKERPEFKGIDVKDPNDDNKSVAITPEGMTVTKVEGTAPNTTTTTSKVGPESTTITREVKKTDPNAPTGTAPTTEISSATYGIDKAEIKDKDGNVATVAPTEIKLGKDGQPGKDSVVLKAADDNNGGSVAVGNKDGKETVKLDGGNGTDAPTVTVKDAKGENDSVVIKGATEDEGSNITLNDKDGNDRVVFDSGDTEGKLAPSMSLKDSDGNDTLTLEGATADQGASINVTGANGRDGVSIDGGKDGSGPSIDFAKDGANGTGTITGLADIKPNETDGSIAANKNYVDSKVKEAAAGQPFEYAAKDDNSKVVRGLDGKLYKEADLNKYYYDEKTSSYKPRDPNGAGTPTELTNDKVVVNLMPKGADKSPISIGNVESVLGAIASKDKVEAAKAIKELIKENGTLSTKKDNVATGSDVAALAKAGLDFGANVGDDIHRNLGEKVSIVGKDLKAEVLKSMGIDTVPADDAANKADYDAKLAAAKKAITDGFSAKNVATVIDTGSNEIVINIADKPEFKAISIRDDEFAGKTLDLTPEAITMEADGITTNMAADGLDVIDDVGNRNNIAADGIEITDTSGNTNSIGANEVHLVDEPNGKDSKLEAGKLVLIKSAGGGDKPEAHIVLEATDKGGKLTGLENRNTSSEGYGTDVSRAATESAVKKNRDDVDNGVVGPMVYTDPQGNRVVKAEDGKYYAAKDVENGKAKEKAEEVKNPALSLANGDRTGDTKAPVVLNNVAGGELSENSNQAVNGAQLHQTNINIQNNSIRIDNLQNQVNTLDKNMRAGVAQAIAQANLPVNILPGKSTLSLATGHYMGTQAFAVGYSRVSDNGKVSVKFSLGHGGKQTSVGAGVGYTW